MTAESSGADTAPAADAEERFLTAFRGSFTSALRWHQLDALWERIRERAGAGWYLYAIGEPPPTAPADAGQVLTFVAEIDRLLALYEEARARYAADPARARAMATDPIGPAPEGTDVAELAAWTVVSNVLLNLDEMFLKR